MAEKGPNNAAFGTTGMFGGPSPTPPPWWVMTRCWRLRWDTFTTAPRCVWDFGNQTAQIDRNTIREEMGPLTESEGTMWRDFEGPRRDYPQVDPPGLMVRSRGDRGGREGELRDERDAVGSAGEALCPANFIAWSFAPGRDFSLPSCPLGPATD